MSLAPLFLAVAKAFDGPQPIEAEARAALVAHADAAPIPFKATPLPDVYAPILSAPDAHACCAQIAGTPLPWAPPTTSVDPKYVADSLPKAHIELLGPGGMVKADSIRVGLYGMLPGHDYGIRTHPAEETFVMLAGAAFWKAGDTPYQLRHPGARAYHPSMLPHANRTGELPFMSVYVWRGDVSTENYVYEG